MYGFIACIIFSPFFGTIDTLPVILDVLHPVPDLVTGPRIECLESIVECFSLGTYISDFAPRHKKCEHPCAVQIMLFNVIVTWEPFPKKFSFGFMCVLSDYTTTLSPPTFF